MSSSPIPFASGFGVLLALLSVPPAFELVTREAATLARQVQGGTIMQGEVGGTSCGVVTACTSGLTSIYRPEEVTSTPGYVRHAAWFGSGEFIWTRNLLLDNLVLARHTAKGPGRR